VQKAERPSIEFCRPGYRSIWKDPGRDLESQLSGFVGDLPLSAPGVQHYDIHPLIWFRMACLLMFLAVRLVVGFGCEGMSLPGSWCGDVGTWLTFHRAVWEEVCVTLTCRW
jgi:hypothetical protein